MSQQDIFNTHPDLGMPTTQGSWALEKCQHDGEALIVKKVSLQQYVD